jgi:hypothetical protein
LYCFIIYELYDISFIWFSQSEWVIAAWTIWHILHLILSEWVSDCCLTPKEQFFRYMNIIVRTSYIQWNDDDVCFVLDQYAELDFYSTGSLKQQSASRQNMLLHSVTNTNFIASGDGTWTGPTTYHTQGEHTNHYTTIANAVESLSKYRFPRLRWTFPHCKYPECNNLGAYTLYSWMSSEFIIK